jgi:sulfatase maturation enzyme AslB (radical SAM superfamily)
MEKMEKKEESFYNNYKKENEDNFITFIDKDFKKSNLEFLKCDEFSNQLVIEFKPSNFCNLDCSYCCFHDKNTNNNFNISKINEFFILIDNMIKENNYSNIYLFIYGGEPTMYSDLEKFVNLFYKHYVGIKIKTVIQSNGVTPFYEEEYKKFLNYSGLTFSFSFHNNELKDKKLLSTFIKNAKILNSLKVLQEIVLMISKDTYKEILKLSKLLQRHRLPIYIRSILQDSKYFKDKKILNVSDKLLITNLGNFSFEEMSMQNFFNYKDYYCEAGLTSILISVNDVYRCDMDFLYNRNKYGNFNTDSGMEIFNNIKNSCMLCTHKFCSIFFSDRYKTKGL